MNDDDLSELAEYLHYCCQIAISKDCLIVPTTSSLPQYGSLHCCPLGAADCLKSRKGLTYPVYLPDGATGVDFAMGFDDNIGTSKLAKLGQHFREVYWGGR